MRMYIYIVLTWHEHDSGLRDHIPEEKEIIIRSTEQYISNTLIIFLLK